MPRCLPGRPASRGALHGECNGTIGGDGRRGAWGEDELREAWVYLQQQAQEAATYLGKVTEGVLAEQVEGAGKGVCGLLCLPSPACAPKVGMPVPGRERVCPWGDTVANAAMRGDGWRVRHDAVKLRLRGLLTWAGIPSTCEVFNLFADCIPQEGLSRIERGRRRQGLVPDFMVLEGPGGKEHSVRA